MLFCLLLAAALAWFILMTWLSHQDGDHTRRTSMFWAQIFSAKGEDEQTLQRTKRCAAPAGPSRSVCGVGGAGGGYLPGGRAGAGMAGAAAGLGLGG